MSMRTILRTVSVMAVLMAGSCGPDINHPLTEDGQINHPITVEPDYRTLKLSYEGSLSAEDAANLSAFVEDYLSRGNGAISISVPSGPDASQTITQLGERLADMGVPRSRILVGIQDRSGSDGRVEIGYISYRAHTDQCGDWSVDAADNEANGTMPNFGCAVQNNIAAEVVDPRDLAQSRGLASADATRRMQVLNNYEHAQTTSAQKTQSQSGAVSDVAGGGSQ
jgi:pilus assembly protein CpaD